MLRHRHVIAALAIVAVAAPLLAAPADAVRARIAGLRELGGAMKGINDALRSSEPQTAMIQQNASKIANSARNMPRWFPANSAPRPGLETWAKPEIWSKPAEFRAAMNAFTTQAAVVQRVSMGTDTDAIKAEVRKLGGTCKGCHDQFRTPKPEQAR